MLTQNRSSLAWASAGVVAVIVLHHRPQAKRTAVSTTPLRLPRRGGQGSTMAP